METQDGDSGNRGETARKGELDLVDRWLARRPWVHRSVRRLWREWLRPFLVILVVMGSFRSVVADWNHVPTGSMKPTILVGDRIFVNKLAYDLKIPFTQLRVATWGHPRRGDLIVFRSGDDRKRLVKRVIGLPHDELRMIENRLFVNGEAAHYGRLDGTGLGVEPEDQASHHFFEETIGDLAHVIMTSDYYSPRPSFDALEVPEDHYFVMGDNRDESFDSRFFGFVDRQRVLGRATAVAISVDTQHFPWLPRWGRFFSDLP